MLTKIQIVSNTDAKTSLALAPLAVLPEFQNNGIGRILLTEAHKKAVSLGFESIVVLGHKNYYTKFGYCKAINFGIKFPFDVPTEFCMIIELTPHALNGISGTVHYPDIFFE